jgi:hypothetical protein
MLFPDLPDGSYAIPDPDRPWDMTFWTVTSGGLTPWPLSAQYGPIRPPYSDPDSRTFQLANFKQLVTQHRQLVAAAIAENPTEAADRFTVLTSRCHNCRKQHKASELKMLADPNPSSSTRDAAPVANATSILVSAAMTGEPVDVRAVLGNVPSVAVVVRLAGLIRELGDAMGAS